MENFRTDTQEVSFSSNHTVMILLNRNNRDLHCKEVLLFSEGPFKDTKLNYIYNIRLNIIKYHTIKRWLLPNHVLNKSFGAK